MLPEQVKKIQQIQRRKKDAELDDFLKKIKHDHIMLQISQYTEIRNEIIKTYMDEIAQSNKIKQLFIGDPEAIVIFDSVISMSLEIVKESRDAIRRYEEYSKNI